MGTAKLNRRHFVLSYFGIQSFPALKIQIWETPPLLEKRERGWQLSQWMRYRLCQSAGTFLSWAGSTLAVSEDSFIAQTGTVGV